MTEPKGMTLAGLTRLCADYTEAMADMELAAEAIVKGHARYDARNGVAHVQCAASRMTTAAEALRKGARQAVEEGLIKVPRAEETCIIEHLREHLSGMAGELRDMSEDLGLEVSA